MKICGIKDTLFKKIIKINELKKYLFVENIDSLMFIF